MVAAVLSTDLDYDCKEEKNIASESLHLMIMMMMMTVMKSAIIQHTSV